MDYDKTPVSQLEYKPVIKLAKLTQKHGFEDWLEHNQIVVKDIWGFYIYNESTLTYCCSFTGSYWLECLGYWFDGDVKSLGKVLDEAYLTETSGDSDLALRRWLEDELSNVPTHEDRFYTMRIERAITLLDTRDKWSGLAVDHVLDNVDPDDDPTYEDLKKHVEEWFYELPCNGGKDKWLELFNQHR